MLRRETNFPKRFLRFWIATGLGIGFVWWMVGLVGCDMRKPSEAEDLSRPPILEMSSSQEAIAADKDTVLTIKAYLVSAMHGILTQRRLRFSAKVGFIQSLDTTNDSGMVKATYYTRNLKLINPVFDTLIGVFEYTDGNTSKSVSDTLVIRLLPGNTASTETVGSIEVSTSRTAVQVRGSGNADQAVISARVFDIYRNRIKDGTQVRFRIAGGPGGGESLNDKGLTDTASTKDGVATVTFHGGTSIGVVELVAVSQGDSAKQALLTITSGPPKHINIVVRKDTAQTAGNRWRMQVQAQLTDAYLNPVKDSIGVLFTVAAHRSAAGAVSITGSAVTGNTVCSGCDTVPGSAFTSITYRSEAIFDTVDVTAETSTGNETLRSTLTFVAPLQRATLRTNYYGGSVFAPSSEPQDSIQIQGSLKDGFGYGVPGAKVCLASDGGKVVKACQITDAQGQAIYLLAVTNKDQTTLSPFRVINVKLVEQSTGVEGATTFMAIFQ